MLFLGYEMFVLLEQILVQDVSFEVVQLGDRGILTEDSGLQLGTFHRGKGFYHWQ